MSKKRWLRERDDKHSKFGKMHRQASKSNLSADKLGQEFIRPETEWDPSTAFAARVVEVHKKYAFVSHEDEIGKVKTNDVWLATIARKYLLAKRSERHLICVGDRVSCMPGIEQGVSSDLPQCQIVHRSPRTATITRPDPSAANREHTLAANMDQVVIVASFRCPTVRWGLIDRYLVLAEEQGLRAVIALTKRDLLEKDDDEEFKARCAERLATYAHIGYNVLSLDLAQKRPLADPAQRDALGALFAGKISLATGHSGVGKSTLLNLYEPELEQIVEENSDIFYKGRHTTTYASFIALKAGGFVIDTPGIRSFGVTRPDAIELSHAFREMRPYVGRCKFRECEHLDEPGCIVRDAVENGTITRYRYESYLNILLGESGREGRTRDSE